MKKEKYQSPSVQMVELSVADVILSSRVIEMEELDLGALKPRDSGGSISVLD